MGENQQSPAGDRQDPAEQYQTDTEVETSEQPDPEPKTAFASERYSVSEGGKLSVQPKEEYVGPSQPVTVAPGAAPTRQDAEPVQEQPVEEPVQTPVSPTQPGDTSSDDSSDDEGDDSSDAS